MLEPDAVTSSAGGRVGLRRAAQYERLMCEHDVVVFESGIHDFGMPFYSAQLTYAKNHVMSAEIALERLLVVSGSFLSPSRPF